MNNLAEKDVKEQYFAETQILVSINGIRKSVTCRVTNFGVTENDKAFQVEIFGIQILGLKKTDYESIPIASQKLIKARLLQKLCNRLENV